MTEVGFTNRLTDPRSSNDPRDPMRALADAWRGYATAVRLGWAVEANWTDPLLFFIYSVAKPIAATLILVFMVEIISGGRAGAFLGFVVTGTALWSFVQNGLAGLAQSVLEDRERYRMLKYLYVSPTGFVVTLLGRGTARIAIGAMGAVITLVFGIVALGIRIDPARVNIPLLLVSMVLGVAAIVAFGMALTAVVLQTRQESWSYGEALAGASFLLVGAVFPLAVLPLPVQAIGLLVPLTWWIEGVRQALFGANPSGVGGPGSLWTLLSGSQAPEPPVVLLALLGTTLLGTLAAAAAFRVSDRRAKERGLIDQTTGS
jgi:ABC-2 type transport system permease protein